MHKNEAPIEPDSSQPENAEPEIQSQKLSKDNLVCCGKKFPRLYNLKRHQKENCRISKSQKSSVVNSIPVNETLIDNDKEATIEELLATDEREEHENSEPSEEEILNEIIPKNIAIQIHTALLENLASEQGSRMTAMDNATRNANDMIDNLTLFYNRSRQALITKELIEIISGAEAV